MTAESPRQLTPIQELRWALGSRNYVPDHYGFAWAFRRDLAPDQTPGPGQFDNYAERPFEEAFDTSVMIPYFAGMTTEERDDYDITLFYSRPKDGKTAEDASQMIAADVGAFSLALLIKKMDFYFRGEALQNIDTGQGPYDIGFTPSTFSSCGWLKRKFAAAAAKTDKHKLAVAGTAR
jgi:hypothetical protein